MVWDFYKEDIGGSQAREVKYLIEKHRKDHE